MANMFTNATGVTNLNLSKLATGRLKNIDEMFKGCSSLQSVQLNEWNFSKIDVNAKNIFANTPNLTEVSIQQTKFGSSVPFSFFTVLKALPSKETLTNER